ncbi:MAG: transcription termination factor Rho [Candidatus Omnitrophica bacterium CG11_big_fil_rev_8_21_14_0_20_45_26]|uniref:Transcription termination factor Rho n=1 Tax=Candidatus Abzuiibacterium crystallinum TaxID=1974748 RepID=A0A2H0LMJ4_9BACT|nr:MAG: transcription termination factor Rho [Candidatus Omnitrophica bacterium CG11_big_fil_rev_8_21_14_0_20_45_26]PIW63759.1 MAG: transcription termination factor Rho [Candidatus Omnitrophica bacterium CG12_big_fil_rev_8_21_14_0_65_45_16]
MRKFNHHQKNNHRHHFNRHRPAPRIPERQADGFEKQFLASTAIDPSPRLRLENGSKELTMRAMDIICPIGMGQRGLIVAPPGSGKTTFLKHICHAVQKGYPEVKLYCLLVDERPEEVTDFKRTVPAEVRSSSSDETYDHHIKIADDLMKQVYRETVAGENVLIVIDSLTRLARVHNAESRSSGRTLSGGMDARALAVPRRIFGSARKIENGGSLTILATILVETGSRMDEVIFEEFKGTGNMEVYLSREISNQRVFPAIHIAKSGTRKEELLLEPGELEIVHKIRRVLSGMGTVQAAKGLVEQLEKYPANQDLFKALQQAK